MAVKYASMFKTDQDQTLLRVSLGDSDNTVEGGIVTWVQDAALTGARTLTVRNYDSGRTGEYDRYQPKVMIKCAVDASVNNLVVEDSDSNTLFTFAADYSVTAAYLVLRLTDALAWELA